MFLNINGNTELVYDLYDVCKIIGKYYNSELAYEMNNLLEFNDENLNEVDENKRYTEELEEIIEEIRRLVG